MKRLLFFLAVAAFSQTWVFNPFTGTMDRVGSGGGSSGIAPYTESVVAAATLTVTAATHGQGTIPLVMDCQQGASPWAAGACSYTVSSAGDVVYTWSPAFTGRIVIGGSGPGAAGTNGTNGTNGAISVLQDDGTPLAVQPYLNFIGAGVTCVDNAGATRTDCTILAGGTVTSASFTGGLISVANPTSTPAFTVAGTSGGVPYFSSASTWASSGALTANLPVIGGGAGAAPTVGSRSGNTTVFVTTTGTQTSTDCVSIDASGNHIASGIPCVSTSATIASGFGTSPSVAAGSTNLSGKLTVGTGGIAITGTVTLGTTYSVAPVCTVSNETTQMVAFPRPTTTTLVIESTTPFTAGDVLSWICRKIGT